MYLTSIFPSKELFIACLLLSWGLNVVVHLYVQIPVAQRDILKLFKPWIFVPLGEALPNSKQTPPGSG